MRMTFTEYEIQVVCLRSDPRSIVTAAACRALSARRSATIATPIARRRRGPARRNEHQWLAATYAPRRFRGCCTNTRRATRDAVACSLLL